MKPPSEDPRFIAAVQMLERTGSSEFQLRYSDDEQPTVWIAVAQWHMKDGRPVHRSRDGAQVRYECAAAIGPIEAVFRLCSQVMDGGTCEHCGRPSGFSEDVGGTMPLEGYVCWYEWDPELQTFRRGCEGEVNPTPAPG